MINKILERKALLETSIKLLESIIKNYKIQEESPQIMLIHNRIRSYKRELEVGTD